MKRKTLILAALAAHVMAWSQDTDSTAFFKGNLYNKEYDVSLNINFYERNVIVSGQEVYGELPGYISKEGSSFCWLITDVTLEGRKAEMELVNDYGSEDLTATLSLENDSIFTLRQRNGSTIKVPNNGKWQKLPSTMTFIRRKTGK